MAWRINAEKVSGMTLFAMNWGLSIGNLLVAIPTVWTLRRGEEENVCVVDLGSDRGADNGEAKGVV